MIKTALLLFLPLFGASGFSQTMPPFASGIRFQCTNADVRWKAAKKDWPKALWIYRAVPTIFSQAVISNVMDVGGFTASNRKNYGASGMVFSPPDGSRNLRISFPEGTIQYWSTREYGPTNLAKDVPTTNQLWQLTADFLPKLGISLSEISHKENSTKPRLTISEGLTEYTVNHAFVTNVEWRSVYFNRAVDGVELRGNCGNCELDFGEHQQMTKIWLSWPNLERDTMYQTAKPERFIQWIRDGKAVYWPRSDAVGAAASIDWTTAKRLTIKKIKAYYWGVTPSSERQRNPLPSSIRPYALLWGSVDTGHGNADVQIGCPIFDEIEPAK